MKNITEKIMQALFGMFATLKSSGNLKQIDISDINECRIAGVTGLPEGVRKNAVFPAGKTIVIEADDRKVTLFAVYRKKAVLRNMPQTGIAGIDVYEEKTLKHKGTASPGGNLDMTASLTFDAEPGYRYILYMPPYATLRKLCIGGASVAKKKNRKKAVFYGSSVTQGCAATRPGLSYANTLCRELNLECLNFGFSESARGEENVIEYIASLKPDYFIIEYDHNSTAEELAERHENVYRIIRRGNKNCQIVLMSRFSYNLAISSSEAKKRRDIIKNTYETAVREGDENVIFIDGIKTMETNRHLCFTDDRHPNDMGHTRIARIIEYKIKKVEAGHGV